MGGSRGGNGGNGGRRRKSGRKHTHVSSKRRGADGAQGSFGMFLIVLLIIILLFLIESGQGALFTTILSKLWKILWVGGAIILGIILATVLGIFLVKYLKKKGEQKKIEDENTENILNVPLETFGDKEMDDLTKKYDSEKKVSASKRGSRLGGGTYSSVFDDDKFE